jgi:hypothetical protein
LLEVLLLQILHDVRLFAADRCEVCVTEGLTVATGKLAGVHWKTALQEVLDAQKVLLCDDKVTSCDLFEQIKDSFEAI